MRTRVWGCCLLLWLVHLEDTSGRCGGVRWRHAGASGMREEGMALGTRQHGSGGGGPESLGLGISKVRRRPLRLRGGADEGEANAQDVDFVIKQLQKERREVEQRTAQRRKLAKSEELASGKLEELHRKMSAPLPTFSTGSPIPSTVTAQLLGSAFADEGFEQKRDELDEALESMDHLDFDSEPLPEPGPPSLIKWGGRGLVSRHWLFMRGENEFNELEPFTACLHPRSGMALQLQHNSTGIFVFKMHELANPHSCNLDASVDDLGEECEFMAPTLDSSLRQWARTGTSTDYEHLLVGAGETYEAGHWLLRENGTMIVAHNVALGDGESPADNTVCPYVRLEFYMDGFTFVTSDGAASIIKQGKDPKFVDIYDEARALLAWEACLTYPDRHESRREWRKSRRNAWKYPPGTVVNDDGTNATSTTNFYCHEHGVNFTDPEIQEEIRAAQAEEDLAESDDFDDFDTMARLAENASTPSAVSDMSNSEDWEYFDPNTGKICTKEECVDASNRFWNEGGAEALLREDDEEKQLMAQGGGSSELKYVGIRPQGFPGLNAAGSSAGLARMFPGIEFAD